MTNMFQNGRQTAQGFTEHKTPNVHLPSLIQKPAHGNLMLDGTQKSGLVTLNGSGLQNQTYY